MKDNHASGAELTLCAKLRFSDRSFLHILLIVVVGFLAYSNTFHAPFQWDEKTFIKDNPVIRDLAYFKEPSRAEGLELYSALKSRYIGYLTFALSYKFHGLNVTGYHVFNFTVHILNALLVYYLVVLTFRTPFLSGSSLRRQSRYIALFSALLFISHPVETEAVTYIFQRLASLAAFFYLLSLVAYVGSGLSTGRFVRYALYALSLVSVVLAMKTKENAFTLPMVVALFEFLFFKSSIRVRVLRLTPLLLTLFIIPLTIVGTDKPAGEIISGMVSASSGYENISREEYLLTEFRVIVTYLRLLLLPINQNIDYDYPVYHSFFNPQVYLSFLFFLSISGLAVYLFCRSKREPSLRLVAFGIFWFFIALSVESSLIPLPMLIDEYRLYLPSVGAFLAATTGAFIFLEKVRSKRIQRMTIWIIILLPLVFSYASYARNSVWGSKVRLWEDVVSKSPHKARPHNNLGVAYWSEGMIEEAIKHYRIAVDIMPDFAEAHCNLGIACKAKGLTDKAIKHYLTALRLRPDYPKAHFNLGVAYLDTGAVEEARKEFEKLLRIRPNPYQFQARGFLDYIEGVTASDGRAW